MPPPTAKPDLTMPHLREARDSVVGAFAGAKNVAADASDAEAPPDPRTLREWSFPFSYTDGQKQVWKGTFTNRILNLGQRIQIGVVRGRRQAGVPLDCMSPRTMELLYIVGWMEESLTKRPDWAQDLFDITDEGLVEALWEQVAGHERTFRGRAAPAAEGQDQPPAGD